MRHDLNRIINAFFLKLTETLTPTKTASSDILFALLVVTTCAIVYLIPFLQYPDTPSNPWPYAYNVIQSGIINSGHFENLVPQFGTFVRMDYGWFVLHHLVVVDAKLMSGLSFESLERIFTFVFSIVFFYGFYLFGKKTFGTPVGFASAIVMLYLPRIHNYLVTFNGEFVGWIILFPALVSFFAYSKSPRKSLLFLTSVLASSLIITNLIVFAEYLLIVGCYLAARIILHQKTKRILVGLSFGLTLAIVLIPLPVLLTTGDIRPGPSSTIGAIFSSRNPVELQYENNYYQNYDWYWKLLVHQQPLQVQLFYLSNDGRFLSFALLLLVPLALIGVASCLAQPKRLLNLFLLLWLAAALFLSSIILSPLFNETVNAGGVRLLLYFGWPLSLVAGKGLAFAWEKSKRNWRRGLVLALVLVLIVEGIQIATLSAGGANANPALYAKEYPDALAWLKTNTSPNTVIVANEWTGGDVWLKSARLSIDEGGKGSATFSSYQEIVTRLNDAATVLTSPSDNLTVNIMTKYNASYVLVWNRPADYYIGFVPNVAFSKFQSSPSFERVFEEPSGYVNDTYSYTSWNTVPRAVIYHLKTSPMSNSPTSIPMLKTLPYAGSGCCETNSSSVYDSSMSIIPRSRSTVQSVGSGYSYATRIHFWAHDPASNQDNAG